MTTLEVSMTGLCACLHTDRAHTDFGCSGVDCDCEGYAPRETGLVIEPARPQTTPPQGEGDEIARLIRKGLASSAARTVSLAEKIELLIESLRGKIDAESEDAKTLREIADLERKLSAAKAKLRGKSLAVPAAYIGGETRKNSVTYGEYPCDQCERVLTTAQGLGAHRARAHEGFNPRTKAAS